MNSPATPSLDTEPTSPQPAEGQGGSGSWLSRLYTGTGGLDVIGRRRMWYGITAAIVLICMASMLVRGFTFGIDFVGGSRIQFPAGSASTSEVEETYSQVIGDSPESVQTVGTGETATIMIRSEALDDSQVEQLQSALFERFHPPGDDGQPNRNAISASDVSETWGGKITQQALIALAVFMVLVTVYITIRYERDMAIAALVSLLFDMAVTAGVYSLIGFEVTPATVIGILTILGFSLYDSVIVFDKVEENTRGVLHTMRRTYAEQTNLAVNQTLMRSFNTTLIGVLPIIGLMVIAVWMLGVGTLQDLALVQLVGLIVGTYSSVFFATPLLVTLKERWGPVAEHTRKVKAKRAGKRAPQRRADGAAGREIPDTPRRSVDNGPRPGARPTGKRQKKRH